MCVLVCRTDSRWIHSFDRNLHPVCPYCESGVSGWLCRAVSKKPNVTVLLLVTERCDEFEATLYRIFYSELQCSLDYSGPFIHRPNAAIPDKWNVCQDNWNAWFMIPSYSLAYKRYLYSMIVVSSVVFGKLLGSVSFCQGKSRSPSRNHIHRRSPSVLSGNAFSYWLSSSPRNYVMLVASLRHSDVIQASVRQSTFFINIQLTCAAVCNQMGY